jgi:hypothetical protein
MRKLAPLFLTTSILAFAAGNAMAMGDYHKTKKAESGPSSMSTSATNQATPPGNSDSSTAGAMKAGEPAARSTTPPSASPTVSANTQNPQGMSYSDKSSSSPGTNAKMDANSGTPTSSTAVVGTTTKSTDAVTALANDDKQALSRQANSESSTIATQDTAAKAKVKKSKKKVAKADTTMHGNPPVNDGAAAGSTTGRSPGTSQ